MASLFHSLLVVFSIELEVEEVKKIEKDDKLRLHSKRNLWTYKMLLKCLFSSRVNSKTSNRHVLQSDVDNNPVTSIVP